MHGACLQTPSTLSSMFCFERCCWCTSTSWSSSHRLVYLFLKRHKMQNPFGTKLLNFIGSICKWRMDGSSVQCAVSCSAVQPSLPSLWLISCNKSVKPIFQSFDWHIYNSCDAVVSCGPLPFAYRRTIRDPKCAVHALKRTCVIFLFNLFCASLKISNK